MNSIGKNPKRAVFFQKMAKLQPDILFAIDTRLDPILDNEIREEWGGKAYFSSFASNSRGVAVFI